MHPMSKTQQKCLDTLHGFTDKVNFNIPVTRTAHGTQLINLLNRDQSQMVKCLNSNNRRLPSLWLWRCFRCCKKEKRIIASVKQTNWPKRKTKMPHSPTTTTIWQVKSLSQFVLLIFPNCLIRLIKFDFRRKASSCVFGFVDWSFSRRTTVERFGHSRGSWHFHVRGTNCKIKLFFDFK